MLVLGLLEKKTMEDNNSNGSASEIRPRQDSDPEFEFVRLLGRGAFADAELHLAKRHVVLKKISLSNKTFSEQPKALDLIEAEVSLHSTLFHPNVLRLYSTWKEEGANKVIMELEYCEGGTLSQAIAETKEAKSCFTAKQVRNWLAQLALGLSYIHDSGIVHHDFKSDNILLTADWSIPKIADFGLAQLVNENDSSLPQSSGTLTYMAPESYTFQLALPNNINDPGGLKNSPKVDVWGFGVVAFEAATLELPFKCSLDNRKTAAFELYNLQISKSWTPEKIVNVGLRNLVENRLLVVDPKIRANMVEVLEDPFIADKAKHVQKCNHLHEMVTKLQEENARQQSLINLLSEKLGQLESGNLNATDQEKIDKLGRDLTGAKATIDKLRKQILANNGKTEDDKNRNSQNLIEFERQKQFFDAVSRGDLGVVRGVLRRELVKINTRNCDGLTALMVAAKNGRLNVVRVLVQTFRANVDEEATGDASTALMFAASAGHLDIVQVLVDDFGADIGKESNAGLTALEMAELHGESDAVQFLQKQSSYANIRNKS